MPTIKKNVSRVVYRYKLLGAINTGITLDNIFSQSPKGIYEQILKKKKKKKKKKKIKARHKNLTKEAPRQFTRPTDWQSMIGALV